MDRTSSGSEPGAARDRTRLKSVGLSTVRGSIVMADWVLVIGYAPWAQGICRGYFVHVYNRFASGQGVSADPKWALQFVDFLRFVKKRDGWTVFWWSLMPNRFHLYQLAIRSRTVPISYFFAHGARFYGLEYLRPEAVLRTQG